MPFHPGRSSRFFTNFVTESTKISLIEKIENPQSFSESKLNTTLGFISFFLPPNYDNFVVQYT